MLADVNTYYTEKPLLRSAKLLSLTMAAILFPRAFSHGRPAAAVVAPRPVRDRNPARRRFYDHRSRNSGRSPPGASRELSQDEERRRAFLRKWRLKCKAVADSLEEAGDRLFTFNRLPRSQWKSARTTNAIERLHEEFKRRIKTRTVLPSAETAAMLFWALLASGRLTPQGVLAWIGLATGVRNSRVRGQVRLLSAISLSHPAMLTAASP